MLILNMSGEKNNKEDDPKNIPVDRPTEPDIPEPTLAPIIREPTKRPKLRVLNIQ